MGDWWVGVVRNVVEGHDVGLGSCSFGRMKAEIGWGLCIHMWWPWSRDGSDERVGAGSGGGVVPRLFASCGAAVWFPFGPFHPSLFPLLYPSHPPSLCTIPHSLFSPRHTLFSFLSSLPFSHALFSTPQTLFLLYPSCFFPFLSQSVEDEEYCLPRAQQLWAEVCARQLAPTRRLLRSYLQCSFYGGDNPSEAEQVAREMCGAGDFEVDGATARLLAAIEMAWQQLHAGGYEGDG